MMHLYYSLATPKDTWPSMEKPGLSMQLDENKDGYDVIVQVYVHCMTQLQPIIFTGVSILCLSTLKIIRRFSSDSGMPSRPLTLKPSL